MKEHKRLNPEEHIQSPQSGEAWKPRYPDKQRPTADPDLNPEPATKLTERLVAETVHGHAPIHGRSANTRTNSGPDRGDKTLVKAVTLYAPRKGEQNEGSLKPQREEFTRRTGLVVPCSLFCIVPKDTSPTAKPSKKTLKEAKERNQTQWYRGL